ncbi:hypothetical protein [Streptomyces sp. NPDC005548]|uniref:hypothetical protein n=1 Tax=Streptomyces sp. NPDC005548 TaxID=3364724 RepID=UPI0036B1AB80
MTTRTPATTTAPKTTAKKPAPTRPARTRRKTTPAPVPTVSLVKLTKPRPKRITLVDLRYKLPVRRRLFVGPMGATEQAAVRAALASAAARLPIPVRTWNGSTAHLTDGTLVIHNPGPDRRFTAHIACRHGAIHGWPIHTERDLRTARALTHACERPHTAPADDSNLNYDHAISLGVGPIPQPKPSVVLALREGVHRAKATQAETQPLSLAEIADGVANRTPDTDTAKEHPQP